MGKFNSVVLVADTADFDVTVDRKSTFLEMTDLHQLDCIKTAIEKMGHDCILYAEPDKFSNAASQHKDDLVFSLWSGKKSRNRRAIIPAICEAHSISYIGADPYTALLCQDKALSQSFTKRFGLDVPKQIQIDQFNSESDLSTLNFPVVVKPTFEGGSIGISTKNLAVCSSDANALAKELFIDFNQPIVIEEFIRGAEVSICIAGRPNEIDLVEAIEVCYSDKPDYLYDRLYSFEEKRHHSRTKFRVQKNVTSRVPQSVLDKAICLFTALGKVDIFRLDGRLLDDDFIVIELTSDVGMSPSGIFASAYNSIGLDFDEMISKVLNLKSELRT